MMFSEILLTYISKCGLYKGAAVKNNSPIGQSVYRNNKLLALSSKQISAEFFFLSRPLLNIKKVMINPKLLTLLVFHNNFLVKLFNNTKRFSDI